MTACAGDGTTRVPASQPALYPPAVFAHRVGTSDLTVYWNCTRPEPDVLRVEGVVQNTGGGSIQYTEVEIVSVDARDRTIASVGAPVRDVILQTNQISPFQLTLRTVGAETRIDLYYVYRAQARSGLGVAQAVPGAVSGPGRVLRIATPGPQAAVGLRPARPGPVAQR